MTTSKIFATLILAASGHLAYAQSCYSSEPRTMDVQDKNAQVRVTVRWNESASSILPRQIAIVKQGQRSAFIGSQLNCIAGNPAKCSLEDDGGTIEIFRYSVTGNASNPIPTCLPATPSPAPLINPLNGLKNIFGSQPAVAPRSVECMKLVMRKGELYVGTLEDTGDAVLAVDSADQDDTVYLQKRRGACPEIKASEDSSEKQPVQPTGEPGMQPPMPINLVEPTPAQR